ncbi:hypothetical protein ETAE_2450 [Edwardsiella piscicida]|uniref:Uncharacterized protein n=1 Tax=Edwardsiella piscicida TaxID=1263550 RepID=A0AAU8P6P0_EDWPI|nr:hypothetical protein ETAE_2450 [Edwardsiella tarda EIB202]
MVCYFCCQFITSKGKNRRKNAADCGDDAILARCVIPPSWR